MQGVVQRWWVGEWRVSQLPAAGMVQADEDDVVGEQV
jgi:hypothetical protein